MQKPKERTKADVKIIKDYFQRYEMLADKEDDFYADIHKVIKIASNFKKGDVIEPDPRVIRILWQGQVEPTRPAYATNVSQFTNQHFTSSTLV